MSGGAHRKIPADVAGYSGCSVNARCFYEGSSKERLCKVETSCIRDQEIRAGHERSHVSPWNPEKDDEAEAVIADAEDRAQV